MLKQFDDFYRFFSIRSFLHICKTIFFTSLPYFSVKTSIYTSSKPSNYIKKTKESWCRHYYRSFYSHQETITITVRWNQLIALKDFRAIRQNQWATKCELPLVYGAWQWSVTSKSDKWKIMDINDKSCSTKSVNGRA